MIRKVVLAAALIAGGLMSTAASAQGIPSLQGRWSEDRTGEEIAVVATGFGYEAWLSWAGQASFTPASAYGSNVKIEGPKARCFYRIVVNNPRPDFRKMTWALRDGSSPQCPQSGVYSGIAY